MNIYDYGDGLYKTIIEGISEGLCVCDMIDSYPFFQVSLCNDRMVEITSYTMEEAVSEEFTNKIFSDDSNRIKFSLLSENLRNGIGFEFEQFQVIRKDGFIRTLLVSASIVESSRKNQVMIIVKDITELRDMEQRLREADELKRKIDDNERVLEEVVHFNMLKTEFFANISHEIRTPLNVIMGAMQLFNLKLMSMLKKDKFVEIERYTGIMKQNCYRVLRLVNNLIDVTKLDSGYMDIELSNVDIIAVVRSITMSVSQYIEDKGIKFAFESTVGEKIIACDPDKIERIMLNLISNSIKFTSPGGEIKIKIEQGPAIIQISVIDTGTGIPEDKLDLIFNRFIQAGKAIDREQAGSGIGLSLVKSLVEMHGGNIFVKSQYGKGSNFTIEIPEKTLPSLVLEKEVNSYNSNGRIERIRVEFSDIYM